MASFQRRRRILLALAVAVTAVGAALAADATKSFDLPAGDAGEALRQFVQQSGSEVMFVPGSLNGVETGGVRGNFTTREALDRLVAGTGLAVTQDGPTDAFAVARKASSDPVLRLPPYFVTDTIPLKWQYVALPGFEILSCCPETETEAFLNEIYRQQAWLDEMVPPHLQARETVPVALILFSASVKKAIAKNIASLARENAARLNLTLADAGLPVPPPVSYLIPQVKLWDEDSTGVDIVLNDRRNGGYGDIEFDPDYVFLQLARRAPPLPPWFTAGVLNLYQTRFDAPQANRGGGLGRQRPLFLGVSWISPDVAGVLRDDASTPRALLPMGDLLTEPIPAAGTAGEKRAWLARFGLGIAGKADPDQSLSPAQARLVLLRGAEKDSPWRRDIWMSQVLLFVRWALDDATYERRHALWKFAARASVEPVTEALFKDCFGLSFDQVGRQLDAYLPTAVSRGLALIPETPLEIPWMEPRRSTEAEEARILGDWERKEYEFVKESRPEYADAYARQAERTFMRAYGDGVRDPDFLAALGIYECTMGDDARARGFLETAVRAGVARPRAYVELARLHYDEALAKPGGPGRRLDAEQVASVLDLLRAGRAQLPPQFETYAQAAAVWEHAAQAPRAADLLMLEEGLQFFPNDSGLMLATARIKARLAGSN